MSKLSLSVVIICLNEEKNLPRCISSVKDWAGEVLVLDSGSTDRTVEVATQLGAKVYQQAWLGFGHQKRKAAELAEHDWILSLDADEVCSEEMALWIKDSLLSNKCEPKIIYHFPRKSFFLGKWILHGGWYPDYQGRLFHRQYSQWDQAAIHEKVRPEADFDSAERAGLDTEPALLSKNFRVPGPILHYVFQDLAHQVQTNNRYSSLQAQDLFDRGVRFSWGKLITKPFSKFLECYLVKGGFLDGAPGFMIAFNAGYSAFLKWAKLWELEKNAKL